MSTELNKEVASENNQSGSVPVKKNRRKGSKKGPRPSVVYGEEELKAVEPHPFWNSVHEGKVVSLKEDGVLVGLPSPDGGEIKVFVPDTELIKKSDLSEGQNIRIYLDDNIPVGEYPISGSQVRAVELDLLVKAREAQEKRESVNGYVIGAIKGGYSVALFANSREEAEEGLGLRAFLPLGRTSLKRNGGLLETEDHLISVQISELDLSRGNIVVSRRELLAQNRKKEVESFFVSHKVGDKVTGTVTAHMPYGAFVNLGPVDGFLHISDISWDKKPRLSRIVPVGKEISAQIIEIDEEAKRVKLSLKELNVDPWQHIEKLYKPGTEVEGTVIAFAEFGAFVKLQDGVEGLIHLGEISWNRIKHPSQRFKIGDVVKAAVLHVDKTARRISLSTKALELSPVERLSSQFPVGSVIKTKVASIRDFGIFVELDEESQGLVPRSEISWCRSDEPLEKIYSIGQEIEVAVLGYDANRQRISCSIKRLSGDPWGQWKTTFKRGSVHKVKVIKVSRAGLECQLDNDLVGFCPWRELADSNDEQSKLNARVGDTIEVVVTNLDVARQRVSLSQKAAVESETKQAYESYLNEQSNGNARTTLGDAFKKIDLNKGKK
ncbi:MAG: S1 RNA-binding domain-containing protein [Myxococcales bacterium]|nr:S1 RNA-binding domain-containing protein [Myxococcales bacterium]USN51447.1 MAG: S1 RNA-binding domain-containing protein [Myxococcales bacterium]